MGSTRVRATAPAIGPLVGEPPVSTARRGLLLVIALPLIAALVMYVFQAVQLSSRSEPGRAGSVVVKRFTEAPASRA